MQKTESMTRGYQARKAPLFQDVDGDVWEVIETLNSERRVTFLTSESKAKVIAFALNAIVEQRILMSHPQSGHANDKPYLVYYDGPTEGI